ncbi:hypothetical protein M3689_05660 [Alkalihalophilus marmarensis]|uniref:hypothetical protein n=1 Tax=Alkalihalophilus marmarensis TaxID=521377 RepID=UPI00203C3A30|nr:hypothetical protein [Alkalihalophilus marmarensis]MCM3488792.1 hypothetical protein [Alkalihalophilus marmarensis]
MIQLKVGGVTYDVKKLPFVEIGGDRNYSGACDYNSTTIEIADDLSEERARDVLYHELTHAIFYEAGFVEQDEDMINRVAKVIHQVCRDNKDILGK